MNLALLLLPAISLVLVAALLKLLLTSGLASRIALDLPNERSLHATPIPRVGGIVLVAVAAAAIAVALPTLRSMALLAGALMLVSALDDRIGLPVPVRLAAHVAAAVVTTQLLALEGGLWLPILCVLVLTWAMNLFNFMDGADGLAGGMAVIGFGALGLAAIESAPEVAAAGLCIAAAAAGFLLHNFPPARVFLGDAGSIPLGFLAGTLGLIGWSKGLWPLWFPVLVFSPFMVDATLTLVSRILRGRKPWQAHREHAYQRMVAGGLGHRRTALLWYLLMAAAAASALIALRLPVVAQWSTAVGWTLIYGILAAVTFKRFPLHRND